MQPDKISFIDEVRGPMNYDAESRLAKELGIPSAHVCVVGSTLICGKGNDTDFLCLVPSIDRVEACGFVPDIELSYESPLQSFRREGQNVIATTDPRFFFAELAIAHAARLVATDVIFDMRLREERIRFHGEIRQHVLVRLT
jgi:hypothetical protein